MKQVRFAVMAIFVALLGSLLVAQPATANVKACLLDVGKRVPVLMVHGLLAKGLTWQEGKPSMLDAISDLSGVYIDEPFDYEKFNTEWVTHPQIGPKLAERIACVAQSSREQGGLGKVVVVAHSMGGLVARLAANMAIGNHAIANDIGLVITIATPNTGSVVASSLIELVQSVCAAGSAIFLGIVCDQALRSVLHDLSAVPALKSGSKELRQLPTMPQSIPVLAVAGNITPQYELFYSRFYGSPSSMDGLVTTSSALHGNTVGGMGGTKEFGCKATGPAWPGANAPCEHGRLLQNPEVQSTVVSEIQQYLDFLATPPCASAQTFIDAMERQPGDRPAGYPFTVVKGPVCEGDIAAAVVNDDLIGWLMVVLQCKHSL